MTEEATTESMIDTTSVEETTTETTTEVQMDDVVRDTTETTPEQTDYLYAGKYKSAEDLEKGYKEVVQKLTEKRPSAPEEYKFDFSEHETLKSQEINLGEDETFQKMEPVFKELNLTQEQADKLVSVYLESTFAGVPDIGEEMKKLGGNANDIINKVNSFVAKEMPEQFRPLAEHLGSTALGVQFVEWMQNGMMRDNTIPTDAEAYAPKQSYQELMAEASAFRKSNPNFDIDVKAQQRYEKMMDTAVKMQIGADT